MTASAPPVRVLATGFGPFPGVARNASAALASELNGHFAPGVTVVSAELPAVWAEARDAVEALLDRHAPHAVLHFGVSKRADCFEIEARAYNASGPKEDSAGVVRPPKPLVPRSAAMLRASLPPLLLARALLAAGYPAAVSADAGRYLCNAVFYWSLYRARGDGPLVSFIHVPAFGEQTEVRPRLTYEQACAGARILVRTAALAVLRRAQQKARAAGDGEGHGPQVFHGAWRRG